MMTQIKRQRRTINKSVSFKSPILEYINLLGANREANSLSEAIEIMVNEHKNFCSEISLMKNEHQRNNELQPQPDPTAAVA